MEPNDLVGVYSNRLMNEYHYPRDCIQERVPYAFGKARYRIDIVVLKDGKPYIVIETSAKTNPPEVIDQLQGYLRATNAEFAVATNGFIDRCYKVSHISPEGLLESIPDIPQYNKNLGDLGYHKNADLVRMSPLQFQEVILHIRDGIYLRQGLSRDETTKQLAKLLLLKVYDETLSDGLFRAHYNEPPENVTSRIKALAMKAREKYPSILAEPPNLGDELLSRCVSILQKYSLRDSGIGIIGSKYPIFDLLGHPGLEFSTRRDVIKLMIDLLNPSRGSTFIDPACGVGGLILEAARRGCKVTGIEINANIAQYARMNLAISGLSGQIITYDSLSPQNTSDSGFLNPVLEGSFDYAAVDPPYGVRIDDQRLNEFSLGAARKSQSSEALFLERTYRFLKQNGKMIIMLPDAFLSSDSTLDAREFAMKGSSIRAIVSLPENSSTTASIRASLLLLERSARKDNATHDVFVAILENFANAERVVSAFRAFQDGRFTQSDNMFVINLISPRKMNVRYLQGAFLEAQMRSKPQYPIVRLCEIASLTTGVQMERIGKSDSNGKFLYVRAGNVGDFMLNLDKAEKMNVSMDASKWLAKPGDILLTRAGTVGRVALVSEDSPQIIIGSNVAKISIQEGDRVLPEYVVAFLASEQGMREIRMYTTGAPIKSISSSALGQIKLPLAPIERQIEIAGQLRRIIDSKRESNRIIEKMRAREEQLRIELNRLTEEKRW